MTDQTGMLAISIAGPLAIAVAVAALAVVIRQRRRSTVVVDREQVTHAQTAWRAPDGLANASLPRAVKVTGTSMVLFAIVVLVLAGSGVLGWIAARASDRQRQITELLDREGVAVEGTITRKWIAGGKSHTHNVTYTYSAPDGPHSVNAQVASAFYNRLSAGSGVRVFYAQSNPAVSRTEYVVLTPPWVKFTVFIPFVAILLVPYLVWQQKKLLAYGTPACAVIERVSPMKGGWMITYQFLAADGDTVKSRCSVSQKPAAGETITIVYDPEKPRRSARYPLKFVKLEDA